MSAGQKIHHNEDINGNAVRIQQPMTEEPNKHG